MHTPGKHAYMQIFMLFGVVVIEILLFKLEEEVEEKNMATKLLQPVLQVLKKIIYLSTCSPLWC